MNTMRDVLISALCDRMADDDSIFFLSADLGAPALDRLRGEFPDRFINVGIAEQSCINTAAGLALEGFTVFAYGIAPFISMRCFEQCRVNLSLTSVVRPLNLTVLGLGAGLSYDISGPSHHCLEDISIFRTLPGIAVYSPSSLDQARNLVGQVLATGGPSYVRLEGKPAVESHGAAPDFETGFSVVRPGTDATIIATGFMVNNALEAAAQLDGTHSVQVIDAHRLDRLDQAALARAVTGHAFVLTLEEAFIGCGGLDALVAHTLELADTDMRLRRMGMPRSYDYSNGDRAFLHAANGIDARSVAQAALKLFGQVS
jgi:transketolase